jgi:uncharacterized protein
MHRGVATFTLDNGKCPRWLFERMVKLGREMVRVVVAEYGPDKFIKRIADPVWFQSLGTVLAFDWNASGLTTILTAALKEAIKQEEQDLGIFICGGKKNSRETPNEITRWGERLALSEAHVSNLIYNSKMSAKVDSSLVQDDYILYHHAFFFSKNGAWTVVQQGMNTQNKTARRYHWFSENIKDLIVEPHTGIASQLVDRGATTLNMSAKTSSGTRKLSVELVDAGYKTLMKDIELLRKHFTPLSKTLSVAQGGEQMTLLELAHHEFKTHPVIHDNFRKSNLEKILWQLSDQKPQEYESLLATSGVGPKTIRALALVSEVIYGAKPSYEDPARYSFAHGGKDATPYPVDRDTYDQTIETMRHFVQKTQIQRLEKDKILRRLIV